jgi:hypothetical protein
LGRDNFEPWQELVDANVLRLVGDTFGSTGNMGELDGGVG